MKDTQENSDPSSPGAAGVLDRALALVEFLRANCPWDAAQTPLSLQRYLLEETQEVLDAITTGDDAALRDELGDLLLNLAFQIVLGEERKAFDRAEVVGHLEEKMRRRHPHLYGLGDRESWEEIKARERREQANATGPVGLLASLPAGMDPLLRAQRMQERVAEVGFDWPDVWGAWEKVREEVEELRHELEAGTPQAVEEEVGDLLFSVINLARLAGVFTPTTLARSNAKFARRFAAIEQLARTREITLESAGLEALDRLWDEVKQQEKGSAG